MGSGHLALCSVLWGGSRFEAFGLSRPRASARVSWAAGRWAPGPWAPAVYPFIVYRFIVYVVSIVSKGLRVYRRASRTPPFLPPSSFLLPLFSAQRPAQDEKLCIATGFSGTDGPVKALQMVVGEAAVHHEYSIDHWSVSEHFIRANHKPVHFYNTISQMNYAPGGPCICCGPDVVCDAYRTTKIDIQVMGFPCTPFSALNVSRYLRDYSPFEHKDCARGQGASGGRRGEEGGGGGRRGGGCLAVSNLSNLQPPTSTLHPPTQPPNILLPPKPLGLKPLGLGP